MVGPPGLSLRPPGLLAIAAILACEDVCYPCLPPGIDTSPLASRPIPTPMIMDDPHHQGWEGGRKIFSSLPLWSGPPRLEPKWQFDEEWCKVPLLLGLRVGVFQYNIKRCILRSTTPALGATRPKHIHPSTVCYTLIPLLLTTLVCAHSSSSGERE